MTCQARIQLLAKGVVVIISCRRRHRLSIGLTTQYVLLLDKCRQRVERTSWTLLDTSLVSCVIPPLVPPLPNDRTSESYRQLHPGHACSCQIASFAPGRAQHRFKCLD